jgi:plasmid stability protein
MGNKTVSLTLRIPEDVHKKLKIMAVLSGKSMTDEIVKMVEKVNLKVPDFNKPVKKAAAQAVGSTEEEVRPLIMELHAKKVPLQGICDALNDKGLLTATGLPIWKKGTVTRMIQRWEQKVVRPEKTEE